MLFGRLTPGIINAKLRFVFKPADHRAALEGVFYIIKDSAQNIQRSRLISSAQRYAAQQFSLYPVRGLRM